MNTETTNTQAEEIQNEQFVPMTMEEISQHSKKDVLEGYENLLLEYTELLSKYEELQARMGQGSEHRREQVLRLLQEGPATLQELADKLNTSTKNISSQLSYLRKDGHPIGTDHLGRKFIVKVD